MPILYTRDDRRRRAVVVITGPPDADEFFACVERHRANGLWAYSLLYDFRQMTAEPTRDTLRKLATLIKPQPGDPPRGPVAMLASDPGIYKEACTYAAMARAHAVIEVFRSLEDAEDWLTKKAGK